MSIKVDNQTIYKAYYGTTPIVNYIGTSSDFIKWPNGWKMGYSNITEIPANVDYSEVTDWEYMFSNCTQLKNVDFTFPSGCTDVDYLFNGCSALETVNVTFEGKLTNCKNMFYNCSKLTTIPFMDTSNVTNMESLFDGCSNLTTIPNLITSNVTNMMYMFYGCRLLTTIPNFNTSNVTNMGSLFYNCSKLTTLPLLDFGKVTNIGNFFGSSNLNNLTDLGGFKDLKIDWNDGGGLARCPNLTYQSIMNVINNLYDFRANGDTTTTRTIKFNSKSIALLSEDDIAIGTAKGWNITA